jgi:hypothetical protein
LPRELRRRRMDTGVVQGQYFPIETAIEIEQRKMPPVVKREAVIRSLVPGSRL